LLPVPFGPDALDILEVATRRFFAYNSVFKMFAAGVSRRVCPKAQRSPCSPIQLRKYSRAGRFDASKHRPQAGFTLLKLLIVVGIVGLAPSDRARIHNRQRRHRRSPYPAAVV
jgi:hypothetical protein